jgi:hypothetical protein
MSEGDLVQMSRVHRKDLPIGIIVEVEPMPLNHVWCEVLWDDGTISGVWNTELEKRCA